MLPTAVYSVSDSRHFIGFVAMLNSLRLTGHDEPVFLVDAGLDDDQRALVSPHVTLIRAPGTVLPVLLAPVGPRLHPASVAIILDADIIVLRPLAELVEAAKSGSVVAFADQEPHHDRFFPEWGPLLGLELARRYPYVNAGQLVVPASIAAALFERWSEGQEKLADLPTRYGNAKLSDPFYFADQDVLNAVVAALLAPEELVVLDNRLAPNPPFTGLRLVDDEHLVCRYGDGTQPFLLHHFLDKPWLSRTRMTAYSLLLPRLLLGADVPLRLEPEQLPPRLRAGRLGAVDRWSAHVQAVALAEMRRQLGRFGIRTRLASWRDRRRNAVR